MHRQSLGSPSPNHSHTTTTLTSSPKASTLANNFTEQKPQKKLHRPEERFIHFIPVLTVLCFLILYLSSHDPSQKELAEFNGFKRLQKPLDTSNSFDGMEKIIEIKEGNVLAIGSLRNLQELEKEEMRFKDNQKHRKIGVF